MNAGASHRAGDAVNIRRPTGAQLGGHWDLIDHVLNHLLRLRSFEDIFDVENDAVTQNVGRHRLHVVGDNEVSALDKSHAPGDLEESQASSGTGANGNSGVLAGQPDELGDVIDDNLIYIDIHLNAALQL